MAEKIPFKALSFSFNDRAHGRMIVRMKYLPESERSVEASGPYLLHVEQGPAERATTSFTKDASIAQASGLCERLLEAGVFSWDDSHPDDPTVGPSRWMLNIIMQEGVFEIHTRGGSMYPVGFDAMMEALYDLGLPRPNLDRKSGAFAGFPGMPLGGMPGGMGSFNPAAMQGLMSQMQQMMGDGFGGASMEDLQMVMRDMQADPSRMQELMRSEFRSMPIEQRNMMLDMLASTGLGSRDWWERFLLG